MKIIDEYTFCNELSAKVIERAIEVHKVLGPGLLESVYESCLNYELQKSGINVERQKRMPVVYKDMVLSTAFRIDLLVEGSLIVEIKSVEAIIDVHIAQMLTYLKFSDTKLGLLLNFNEPLLKKGIRRVIR